ncbi:radical SAM family heme chaperone HemW [Candidatus Marinarcus aquaticus]|uniref:radical SAM family heme chaperone HemW n=1 Tax=Candidatus Marinarcus aquaticus TaxID=2044504 RepID=UPI003012C74D
MHIPFCDSKCFYCAFNSYTTMFHLKENYMKALYLELKTSLEKYQPTIETLFIGGGTPSTILAKHFAPIFDLIQPYLLENAEITTEANPNSATLQWQKEMYDLGVNRISFGVQSFDDDKLKFLGRAHNGQKAIQAVNIAYKIGFKNINCDLIYGVANDTLKSVKKDIDIMTSLPINHISAYSLTLEEGTKFFDQKRVKIDDEELSVQLFEYLETKGFKQYEISNFALSNEARSQHNLGYWKYKEYLGIGAGAVGCINNKRYYATSEIDQFISAPNTYEIENLSEEDIKTERILLGLRSVVGFEKSLLNEDEFERAKELIENGQLVLKNEQFFALNYLLADEIALYVIN